MPFRALLVEDNRPLRELNRLLLEGSGQFQVVGQADNGLEAIRDAERLRPDVILMDLAMPVMNGFDALGRVRQAAPEAVVIALSMLNPETAAPRALSLGADAFLDKGTPDEELAASLVRIIRDVRSRRTAPPPSSR